MQEFTTLNLYESSNQMQFKIAMCAIERRKLEQADDGHKIHVSAAEEQHFHLFRKNFHVTSWSHRAEHSCETGEVVTISCEPD